MHNRQTVNLVLNSITVNPCHAWPVFLKFERSFEIYMSVLNIAGEISEFSNFPTLLTV